MAIAVEIRTTCERCKDPLPLNAWATSVPCWACLHQNPVSPEHWAQLLRGALEDAGSTEGEGRTENLRVGQRSFEVRWSVVHRPKGKPRPRPDEMRADLFPGVVGLSGEETEQPASTRDIAFKCPQCAAALTIDGRSRQVTCSYCQATTQLSDDAWRRIHPVHAQRAWVLVLEGEGAPSSKAAKEGPKTRPYSVWEVTLGPDGLIYAAVEIEEPAVVCLGADLDVRWRTDVKKLPYTFTRVAVVGDEIWVGDPERHAVRRYARADGREIGKIGGVEPFGAKVHHLDLKGCTDLVGCPDGTVLALVAHRIVRFDAKGQGIPTWPPATGLAGWFFGEKVRSLYSGPPPEDEDESIVSMRQMTGLRDGIVDQLGENRPTQAVTVTLRVAVGPDGALWFYDGAKLHHYGRDGRFRWAATLPDCTGNLTVRPGLDAAGNAFVIGLEDDGERSVLFRVDPQGRVARLADHGLGRVNALVVTPDARLIVFGSGAGEVRFFDRDGQRTKATAAAVDADRQRAAEEAEEADEFEE